MGAYKLHIGTNTEYLKWDGANLHIAGNIIITGGSGIANLTDAGALAIKDKIANTDLGTTIISGGYLRTDLIKVRKIYVGGGTNEDIYFEDSEIRVYDVGTQCINFYKAGLKILQLGVGAAAAFVGAWDGNLTLFAATKSLTFYSTGEIQYPLLTSAPTGAKGRFAYNSTNDRPAFKNASEWRYWTGLSGW